MNYCKYCFKQIDEGASTCFRCSMFQQIEESMGKIRTKYKGSEGYNVEDHGQKLAFMRDVITKQLMMLRIEELKTVHSLVTNIICDDGMAGNSVG